MSVERRNYAFIQSGIRAANYDICQSLFLRIHPRVVLTDDVIPANQYLVVVMPGAR